MKDSYSVYCKNSLEALEMLNMLEDVGGYKWQKFGCSPLSVSIETLFYPLNNIIIHVDDSALSVTDNGTYDYTFNRWKEEFADKTNPISTSEIIYVLNYAKDCLPSEYDQRALNIAIKKLNKLEKYEELGTVEEMSKMLNDKEETDLDEGQER